MARDKIQKRCGRMNETIVHSISDLIEVLERFRDRYGDRATVEQVSPESLDSCGQIFTVPTRRVLEIEKGFALYGIPVDKPTLILF